MPLMSEFLILYYPSASTVYFVLMLEWKSRITVGQQQHVVIGHVQEFQWLLVVFHCLQKKEKNSKSTQTFHRVFSFIVKLLVFLGHGRSQGATRKQGPTRRGAAWTQGFCIHSQALTNDKQSTWMSWWIHAVFFFRETKGCQERLEPRERGGLEILDLK